MLVHTHFQWRRLRVHVKRFGSNFATRILDLMFFSISVPFINSNNTFFAATTHCCLVLQIWPICCILKIFIIPFYRLSTFQPLNMLTIDFDLHSRATDLLKNSSDFFEKSSNIHGLSREFLEPPRNSTDFLVSSSEFLGSCPKAFSSGYLSVQRVRNKKVYICINTTIYFHASGG